MLNISGTPVKGELGSEAASSATLCSISSQEELNTQTRRPRRTIRTWINRWTPSCTQPFDLAIGSAASDNRSAVDLEAEKPQIRPRWTQCLRVFFFRQRRRHLAKTSNKLKRPRRARSDDWETAECTPPAADTEGIQDVEDTGFTLVDSATTPIESMSTTCWEMAEVIRAVETDDASEECDTSPSRSRSQPPQLDTVSEADETWEEIECDEAPSKPLEQVIIVKGRVRLLSILWEDDEYDPEDNDGGPGGGQPDASELDSFVIFEPDSDEREAFDDDEVPAALASQLSHSAPPTWQRKRVHSAPAILPSQTLSLPPSTPPQAAPTSRTSTPPALSTPPNTPLRRSCNPRSCTPPTPGTPLPETSLEWDTSSESTFEALRRLWTERCEADSSLGSVSSRDVSYAL